MTFGLERVGGDSERAVFRVPAADHPLFEGHFEGDPLLPAWIQLALVQELAGDAEGLVGVRLRDAVRPGDELTVEIAGPRFEVRTERGACATGRLVRGDG